MLPRGHRALWAAQASRGCPLPRGPEGHPSHHVAGPASTVSTPGPLPRSPAAPGASSPPRDRVPPGPSPPLQSQVLMAPGCRANGLRALSVLAVQPQKALRTGTGCSPAALPPPRTPASRGPSPCHDETQAAGGHSGTRCAAECTGFVHQLTLVGLLWALKGDAAVDHHRSGLCGRCSARCREAQHTSLPPPSVAPAHLPSSTAASQATALWFNLHFQRTFSVISDSDLHYFS